MYLAMTEAVYHRGVCTPVNAFLLLCHRHQLCNLCTRSNCGIILPKYNSVACFPAALYEPASQMNNQISSILSYLKGNKFYWVFRPQRLTGSNAILALVCLILWCALWERRSPISILVGLSLIHFICNMHLHHCQIYNLCTCLSFCLISSKCPLGSFCTLISW